MKYITTATTAAEMFLKTYNSHLVEFAGHETLKHSKM
jgi:hypothetical protein